jgi:hypothetical protein
MSKRKAEPQPTQALEKKAKAVEVTDVAIPDYSAELIIHSISFGNYKVCGKRAYLAEDKCNTLPYAMVSVDIKMSADLRRDATHLGLCRLTDPNPKRIAALTDRMALRCHATDGCVMKFIKTDMSQVLHTVTLVIPPVCVYGDTSTCSICYQSMDGTTVVTPCGHQFHVLCMHEYLKFQGCSKDCPECSSHTVIVRAFKCPICKRVVDEPHFVD